MEDLDLAYSLALARLPFSQDHPEENITVSLQVKEFYKDPLHILGIGVSGLDKQVHFCFRKEYVGDILIGWQFTGFYRQES